MKKLLSALLLVTSFGAVAETQTAILNCDVDTNIVDPVTRRLVLENNIRRHDVVGAITVVTTNNHLSFTVNSYEANYHSGPVFVNRSKINGNYKYLLKISSGDDFKFFFEDTKTNVIAMFYNCHKIGDL